MSDPSEPTRLAGDGAGDPGGSRAGDGLAGTTVDGRYVLEEQIDSGGFATVWRATDETNDRPVAVKFGHRDGHDWAEVRSRFQRELAVVERFDGGVTPGALVQFVGGTADDEHAYLATELVRGGSIRSRVARGEDDPGVDLLAAVGVPLCRAFAFLHLNGVTYLDLKPSNVLHREAGPPALVDFNTAMPTGDAVETLFHFDPFKPPELTPTDAREAAAGPWSDVYSLGKLFAYLLTGSLVYQTLPSPDQWRAVDPRDHGADCPEGLAAVIRQATAPDPDGRFEDAVALCTALTPHLGMGDQHARVEPPDGGGGALVHPGSTIGRWAPDATVPTVVLADDDEFVSPEHAVVAYSDGHWLLRDQSLNGTYVRKDDTWVYLLSERGIEQRETPGGNGERRDPDQSVRLEDGDRIAPVDPDYGQELVFRTR